MTEPTTEVVRELIAAALLDGIQVNHGAADRIMAASPEFVAIIERGLAEARTLAEPDALREALTAVLRQHDPEGTGYARWGGDALLEDLRAALGEKP